MMNKLMALAMTVAVSGVLAAQAFADVTGPQNGGFVFSPVTASDDDAFSNNNTDVGNIKDSLNTTDAFNTKNSGNTTDALNTKDSFNTTDALNTKDSFNANNVGNTYNTDSYNVLDSYNDCVSGQVAVNESEVGDINAADHGSTILDGDVTIGCCGGGEGGLFSVSSTSANVNSGIASNSIIGDSSAQFNTVGVGNNNSSVYDSNLTSTQNSNINLLQHP